MGVPVVSVGAEGTLGGVDPGVSGYLVSSGDWQGMARYASQLLADAALLSAMSAGARQFARRFSSSKMAEQMLGIYLQAIAQQGWRAPDEGDRGTGAAGTLYARAMTRSIRKYGLRGF